MIALTDAFVVLSIAMALCAGALSLSRFGRCKNFVLSPWVKGVLLALFIGLLVPKTGASIPLAAFFRGFIGDLSITLLAVVAATALLLYPTALGWGDWDAYRMGWGVGVFAGFASLECWSDGVWQPVGLFAGPLVVCVCFGICRRKGFYKMLTNRSSSF